MINIIRKMLVKVNTGGVQSKLHTLFCIILITFLMICVVELYMIVMMDKKFKYKSVYPELEMRPIINGTPKNGLIWYNENNVTTVDKYIKLTDDFIEAYRMHPEPPNVAQNCNFNRPRKGQICPLDLDNFGPCIGPFYGYYSFSPCIFLKLAKIYNWRPNYYTGSDKLPSSMPKDLITTMTNAFKNAGRERRQVWVSCEGEHDVDKESIEAINYYPSRGFPFYYFPVKLKDDEYLSPLIAVEIINPKPGFIIHIKCRAWTKDLVNQSSEQDQQKATLHFGIMREALNYEDESYPYQNI